LTEISIDQDESKEKLEQEPSETELGENQDFENSENEDEIADNKVNVESFGQNDEKKSGCKYHLGYLGEEKHEQIPDDCLICSQIIECMHQKSKNN
jgi:hypothetical protein